MKIPTEIVTKNKLRDSAICNMYATRDDLSTKDIASLFRLSLRQIARIVYKNRHVIKIDKDWEETKSLRWLKRQRIKKGDTKRDALDIQDRIISLIKKDNHAVEIGVRAIIFNLQNSPGLLNQDEEILLNNANRKR